MPTNRLTERADGPLKSLQERCDEVNAQMILKGINEDRSVMGLAPVHWVVRDKRLVCDWK